MAQVSLKKLVRDDIISILQPILKTANQELQICDLQGKVILGEAIAAATQYPIVLDEETLGLTTSAIAAEILAYLAAREHERKTLAKEILDKYREINLICNIAEKLACCMSMAEIAKLAIAEAQRLVKATSATVLLREAEVLRPVFVVGDAFRLDAPLKVGEGLVGTIIASGKGEVVCDVAADFRFVPQGYAIGALICAPLLVAERVTGALILSYDTPIFYTASDFKLISAIAAQVSPAFEQALRYERELQEAREREEKLRHQVEELKVEIDQAKRQRQVAEITESERFSAVQARAEKLRQKRLSQLGG